MKIEEITPGFGARITEVDLSAVLSPEEEAAHVEAIGTYGVCVYPQTGLDDAGHVQFSKVFGNLWTIPSGATSKPSMHACTDGAGR